MMEAVVNDIIKDLGICKDFLNQNMLFSKTHLVAPNMLDREKLAGVRHLHMIGTEDDWPGELMRLWFLRQQCYMDNSGEWLAVFGGGHGLLNRIVSACAPGLEKLDICGMNWNCVDVSRFAGLRSLELSDMEGLRQITGLENIRDLDELILNRTPVGDRLDVSLHKKLRTLKLRGIRSLYQIQGLDRLCCLEHLELNGLGLTGMLDLDCHRSLRYVKLRDLRLDGICLHEMFEKLECVDVIGVPLADSDFVRMAPNLKELVLSDTNITCLPDLSKGDGLEVLNMNDSPVWHIAGLPAGIRKVYLDGTELRQIPAFFRELRQISQMHLRNLQLEALPSWLPELKPFITADEFAEEDSIALHGTTVPGVDTSIFLLPRSKDKEESSRQKVKQWFASRDREESPVLEDYAKDGSVLEFHMEFELLPDALIDRLWMKRWDEADRECIWSHGARLIQKETGVSAVIYCDANVLKCLFRASERSTQLHDYLSCIKKDVDLISADMKLHCLVCRIMHKVDGKVIPFSYDELLRKHQNGEEKTSCGLMLYPLYIVDILNQNNRPVDEDRDQLVECLVDILTRIQNRSKYREADEDDYNDAVVDGLENRGYIIADQTRGGTAGNGGGVGRVDMSIRKAIKPNKAWTLYEGLILTGNTRSQMSNWDRHLIKVMNNYNHKGLPFVLLVSYVKCAMEEFCDYCKEYYAHLCSYAPSDYHLCSAKEMSLDVKGYQQNEFIMAAMCQYRRINPGNEQDGFVRTVYHIFARFGV